MGGPQIRPKVPRTLPRSRRLQRSGEFLRLKSEGHRQVVGCLICNWQECPPAPGADSPAGTSTPPWAGLPRTQLGVVSSRSVGGAVERNRARRLMREAFRLHQSSLQRPVRMVLVARPSIARRDFAAVERDFLQCLRRAGLHLPAPSPTAAPTA